MNFRSKISLILLGVFALLMSFPLLYFTSASAASTSNVYKSTVKSVTDGDTIHITEPVLGCTKVRFLGIDAPETFTKNGKDPGNQIYPHGNNAKEYLKSVLQPGTEISLITGKQTKDRYGRLLAYVKVGNINLCEEMLRRGLVVTYIIWPNTVDKKTFEKFRNALLYAKNNNLGIWDKEDPLQELPFEYRHRIREEEQEKFVGDYYIHKYVFPEYYNEIPIENRVFFMSENEAIDAGYTCDDN